MMKATPGNVRMSAIQWPLAHGPSRGVDKAGTRSRKHTKRCRPNVSYSCLDKCLGSLVSLFFIRCAANALCSHSLCGQRTGLTLALRATYWADARTAAPTNAVATVTLSIVDWSPTLGVIPSRARHEDMCVKEKKTLPSGEKKTICCMPRATHAPGMLAKIKSRATVDGPCPQRCAQRDRGATPSERRGPWPRTRPRLCTSGSQVPRLARCRSPPYRLGPHAPRAAVAPRHLGPLVHCQ